METKKLSISAVLRRAWSMLLYPFEKYLWLFLLITICISGGHVIGYCMNGFIAYAVYQLSVGCMVSYIIVLFCSIIPYKLLRRVVAGLLLSLSLCIFVLDMFCVLIMQTPFNCDFAAALLGTNLSEASEFIATFVNVKTISFIVISSIGVFAMVFYMRKLRVNRLFAIIMFLSVIACSGLVAHNPAVCNESVLTYYKFFHIETPPDLREYEKDIPLQVNKDDQPQVVVLVIGEAHRRVNNSLYGYSRNTNSRLTSIKEEGHLLAFPNVISPDCTTVPSFKCLMSTYSSDCGDDVQWYTCATLPFVMRKAGYKTIWVSNQSKKGFFDNVVGAYSELCDSNVFVGNMFSGLERKNYDEELLPILEDTKAMFQPTNKQFLIVHLMGSHEKFNKRFPESFAHFKASDYAEYKESQRQTRADYDNSVLYTDYVVSEIFKMFSDKDCIGIYLSDHGLDLYDTRDDYAAQGTKENPASFAAATKIPFLVYTTDKYKSLHPEMMQRIEESVDRPFRTDSLIYRIMEIASCRFE